MKAKKDINITVGMNIKREREKVGFTQERFSELIGIGEKSLSAIECGAVGVSLTTLCKICRTLSVSSDTLLFVDNRRNDVSDIAEQLELLTPEQYKIACDVLRGLLAAFSLNS